jgi:CDP-4-dehydro-6-deoxyglucose reductase
MAVQYHDAEIIDIIDESPIVKRYYFKMPESLGFTFKAGQFVMLDLPIEAKFTNRSYSIASAPNNEGTFELCIVLKEDGMGTPYLWKNIEVGTKVKTAGPFGKFVLHDEINTDLCFIATGTGIAPLRSMLLDIYEKNIPHKDIYMIFGNRKEQDILYRAEMEALQAKHPEFKFIPVLSRPDDTWKGATGYVHPYYMDYLGNEKKEVVFYICGWSSMVREARDKLKEIGYSKLELKFELYD